MPIEMQDKYWRISDLQEKYGLRQHALYPILKSIDGVKKIGMTLLLPDTLLPVFEARIKAFIGEKRLTLRTVTRATRVSMNVIQRVVAAGFPHEKKDGVIYIKKGHVPALKMAADDLRAEYGKVSILKSKEFTEKALNYLAEDSWEND